MRLRYDPNHETDHHPAIALMQFLSLSCFAGNSEEPKNYCQDTSSWQQWHDMLRKYPQDDAMHALYATRRGLCTMVDSGQIDLDRATRIFERMRESLMDKYREKDMMEQEGGKRAM